MLSQQLDELYCFFHTNNMRTTENLNKNIKLNYIQTKLRKHTRVLADNATFLRQALCTPIFSELTPSFSELIPPFSELAPRLFGVNPLLFGVNPPLFGVNPAGLPPTPQMLTEIRIGSDMRL